MNPRKTLVVSISKVGELYEVYLNDLKEALLAADPEKLNDIRLELKEYLEIVENRIWNERKKAVAI